MFIYLDKENAKLGLSLVYGVFEKRKKDYIKDYDGKALEYEGENLPHFITYILETDSIREATEEEKLERGQRTIAYNEILKDGKIITYDYINQKIVNGEILDKTRNDYIEEGTLTIESEKEKARLERENQFKALDLYDKAVLRGDIEETQEMKKERDEFRESWLKIPNNYSNIDIPIENFYPVLNKIISYFL